MCVDELITSGSLRVYIINRAESFLRATRDVIQADTTASCSSRERLWILPAYLNYDRTNVSGGVDFGFLDPAVFHSSRETRDFYYTQARAAALRRNAFAIFTFADDILR